VLLLLLLLLRQEAQQGQRCDLLQQAQPQVAGAQPAAQEDLLGGRQALGQAQDLHQGGNSRKRLLLLACLYFLR
jgi:hypothetical protein